MAALLANAVSCLLKIYSRLRRNNQNITLPPVCHAVLDQSTVGNRPVFVVGDVHGCIVELTELLKTACGIHPDTVFAFVGDLVNKGPDSPGVVKCVREMYNDGRAFSVRGNHDESAIREILRREKDPSYNPPEQYSWIKRLHMEDARFLCNLPYTLEIPHLNTILVHAGIVPGKCLELQKLNDLTNMRNIIRDGSFWDFHGLVASNKTDRGDKWTSFWTGPQHVYFGHDARRLLQEERFATGLDTGCCYGGRLTGVFVNGCGKMLSIEAKTVYVQP